MDRVKEILQQIHSTHFATLWLFYRKHFPDDGTCLQFLYDAILFNPFSKSPLLTMDERMEYKYYMVFETKQPNYPGAYSLERFMEIVKGL